MHEIGLKLKLFIFFLNFDLAKGGRGFSPLSPPWLRPCLSNVWIEAKDIEILNSEI